MKHAAVLVLLALLLAACAPSRRTEGPELARTAGWRWEILPAGTFDIAVARPRHLQAETLTVYLEGDGFAYVSASRPARDPTPVDPVALRMALSDPAVPAVAWIGRPCQYTLPEHGRNCRAGYWTLERYAPEVVDGIGTALDALKRESGARRLVLAGYSGGGAVAVLLAARRTDVAGIVTAAANLDVEYWTRRKGVSPLAGSLDPADVADKVADIPQTHFMGGRDEVVGAEVTRAFLRRLSPQAPARLVEIADFTHSCCWAQHWPDLIGPRR
jgi:hypothetical protein